VDNMVWRKRWGGKTPQVVGRLMIKILYLNTQNTTSRSAYVIIVGLEILQFVLQPYSNLENWPREINLSLKDIIFICMYYMYIIFYIIIII